MSIRFMNKKNFKDWISDYVEAVEHKSVFYSWRFQKFSSRGAASSGTRSGTSVYGAERADFEGN
jgi:hypothetical protein